MNFSVIIPTKDRQNILSKSLDCLKQVPGIQDLDVIVINDSDIPVSIDSLNFPKSLRVLKNPGKGVASARNFGVSNAVHEWLIFMDDDMMVRPDTFKKLETYYSDKNAVLNVNWVYTPSMMNLAANNPFVRYLKKYRFDSMEGWSNDPNWNNEKVFEVPGVNSAFLLINKSAFLSIGGFDEKFPFAGFEDHDLSERLKKSGVKMFVDPTNVIFHNEEDRMKIENWLERKRRGAITRKVAVSKGYTHYHLQYSPAKKLVNRLVYASREQLLAILNHWPKNKRLDSLFFIIVNRLLGAYSYAGYTQNS